MSKHKYLFKNSALFSVSTVATKLISVLMVPLYTYVFTTAQYGMIEIIMASINLISPILILGINDAVLRFTFNRDIDKSVIFSYGLFIGLAGTIISFILMPILKQMDGMGRYAYTIIILLSLMSMYRIISHFAMGADKIRIFVISNILVAVMFALFNILFLVVFKLKIDGYLLSFIFSNAIAILALYVLMGGNRYLTCEIFKKENYVILRNMIAYSFPLITNSLMWWVTNASDRYIVYYLLGSSATGIYAVANKIPVILSSTMGIFNQAWQLSAIKEYDSENKNIYYTGVYVRLFSSVLIISSFLIAFLKIILKTFVSKEYYIAWQSAPLLILAAGISIIASFLGANYVAAQKNIGNMLSTGIGALINVGLNFILIPIFNLSGAAFSTFISYIIVVVYRLVDTRKFVMIDWASRKIIISFVLTLAQIVLIYFDRYFLDMANILLFGLVLIINRYLIVEMCQLLKNKFLNHCCAVV